VAYHVLTLPFNWLVQRRFSDFFALRTALMKAHPGINIPPIPSKKTGRGFEGAFLAKRSAFLSRFLQECMDSPVLRNSPYFYTFVSDTDESKWKKDRNAYDKVQDARRLEDFWSPIGKITLTINLEAKATAVHMTHYVEMAEPIYKRLRRLTKELGANYDRMANTLYDMSESFAYLHRPISTMNRAVVEGRVHSGLLC
jgi:hypothetical protein